MADHTQANLMEDLTQANLFELSGNASNGNFVHVTLGTVVLGGPRLHYRDHRFSRSFSREEIHLQDTDLGQVFTVTLEAMPDAPSLTFSLVVPIVTVIRKSTGTRIRVPGLIITNPSTIAGPPPGPQKRYSIVELAGTAQFIVS